jgi:hypothetical protein
MVAIAKSSYITQFIREGGPKGWFMVLVTALGSWENPVPPNALYDVDTVCSTDDQTFKQTQMH